MLALAALGWAILVNLRVASSACQEPPSAAAPTLVGRLLDEEREPIRGASIGWTDWCYYEVVHGSGSFAKGYRLETDQKGRFEFLLPDEPGMTGALRAVQFHADHRESYEVVLPQPLPSGRFDLGDLQLARPGSIRWLADKDDAGLEAEYRRAVVAQERNGVYQRSVETCLTEMIRRGGAHWQAFVESELAHERTEQNPNRIEDLELLTAMRRIQGKPDPLAVQLVGSPELECTFPQVPTVRVRLRNVDVDGELFQFTFGPRIFGSDFPADVQTRFAVEVLDPSGQRVTPLPVEPVQGSIQYERAPLEQGMSLELELPLAPYLQWPGAGEFQMRVLYHDRAEIAEGTGCDGWIASSTTWFIVHVKAKRIWVSRAEFCALADRIGEIDLSKPVLLVRGHWESELAFDRAPETPEDHLFRAGWKAVPALLEALESKDLEPKRRAWVLGLLWNITGALNPAYEGAMGAFHWSDGWPGTSFRGGKPIQFESTRSRDASTLQPKKQEELTQRWKILRKSFDITIVE
jgi:hypothetical protein